MANRLTDMIVDEVSFVKRGANPDAHVVLWKMDEESDVNKEGDYEDGSDDDQGKCSHPNAKDGDSKCPDCGAALPGLGKAAPSSGDVHEPTPVEDIRPKPKVKAKKKKDDDDDEEEEAGDQYVQPPSEAVASSSPSKHDKEKAVKKSDLPEAVAKHLEGDDDAEVTPEVMAEAVDLAVAEGTAKFAADLSELGKGDEADDPISKADPEIQALFKAQQAETAEAVEIAKGERDARLTKEFTDIAKGYTNLPVETEEFGGVLKTLAEADADLYAAIKKVLDAANESNASLFKANGADPRGDADGTSLSAIEKAAEIVRTENPDLSRAEAEDVALQRNPDLYARYIAEHEGA